MFLDVPRCCVMLGLEIYFTRDDRYFHGCYAHHVGKIKLLFSASALQPELWQYHGSKTLQNVLHHKHAVHFVLVIKVCELKFIMTVRVYHK